MHQRDQITAREAAALLGCSIATVNRMAADGRLPRIQKFPWKTGPNIFDRAVVELVARQQEREREEAKSA